MWDLIVSVPDHCLSFYSAKHPSQTFPSVSKTSLSFLKVYVHCMIEGLNMFYYYASLCSGSDVVHLAYQGMDSSLDF